MKISALALPVFELAFSDYHITDNVDAEICNPLKEGTLGNLLYQKAWIDAVQWHLEDLIRNPDIDAETALKIKRRIDKSNQDRTDIVELIDNYYFEQFKDVKTLPDATLNTESPAWAIDRLSILLLKIIHWQIETERVDISDEHKTFCKAKLDILLQQCEDLSSAIDQLLTDIEEGKKIMKTYKQLKMYNDPKLNPVLYNNKR
ncbi:MAG: DUF4254 domain-containing protein [Dysgonamonadaceae bacterium]|jgi:hypothetical protein|nr:DUF4254 domain-containing protein [Dysgonamonadaceae bacterium]